MRRVANAIEDEFDDVDVDGARGRGSSFEITFRDTLVWSKLGGQGFPEPAAVVEKIRELKKSEK
jgi:selT/selW/selH-like putative selenoprotein